MRRFRIIIPLLFCLTAVFGQQQKERVIRFHSDIQIDADGRIEVVEHIKLYAAGIDIKRGFARDLPLYRENKKGRRVRMDYKILSVRCNNVDTKYKTENENGNLAVYIGDEDVFLKAGEYDYIIRYQCYGHIGFFDDFDELYWNVTGTDWMFPIEKASAAITLPGNAVAGKTDYYTGRKGATGKNCSVENRGNVQMFTTTQRLAPYEGLSVVVTFPRDIVSRPPPPPKVETFWYNHRNSICGWTGVLICLFYFFNGITKMGKRPVKPIVIPTFKPPRDLSPAAVFYLTKRLYNSKAFTATLVEMAVKGALNIRCEKKNKFSKKKYSLINKSNTERLRPEEKKIHTAIFDQSETVEVSRENNAKFYLVDTECKESIEKQWNIEDFFHENHVRIFLGGILLFTVFGLYLFLTGATDEILYALAVSIPFIGVAFFYFLKRGFEIRPGWKTISVCIFIALIAMMMLTEDNTEVHLPSMAFFTLMPLFYMWYGKRIRMFTPDGAQLDAELKGFKMYMKIAEEHRLNLLTPPERTPELFEKLLPYAIALGVSNDWCKKFNDVLKQFNYHPEWYNDVDDFSSLDFTSTFAALGSSFNSSITISSGSSSSGSSDWSSGSDGGGSSGGGGGGGGGRGW